MLIFFSSSSSNFFMITTGQVPFISSTLFHHYGPITGAVSSLPQYHRSNTVMRQNSQQHGHTRIATKPR
jgi:hypothetical protein